MGSTGLARLSVLNHEQIQDIPDGDWWVLMKVAGSVQ